VFPGNAAWAFSSFIAGVAAIVLFPVLMLFVRIAFSELPARHRAYQIVGTWTAIAFVFSWIAWARTESISGEWNAWANQSMGSFLVFIFIGALFATIIVRLMMQLVRPVPRPPRAR
jgi:NADH:ubiquinone oxidoreductase subunit 6 (subunit J)